MKNENQDIWRIQISICENFDLPDSMQVQSQSACYMFLLMVNFFKVIQVYEIISKNDNNVAIPRILSEYVANQYTV